MSEREVAVSESRLELNYRPRQKVLAEGEVPLPELRLSAGISVWDLMPDEADE
jgi:hypothetical protein